MIALKHLLYATALAASVHAQLYAAPDGDGEACSQSTPCSLDTALTTADAGASIKLAGAYVLPMARPLYVYGTASIHGTIGCIPRASAPHSAVYSY